MGKSKPKKFVPTPPEEAKFKDGNKAAVGSSPYDASRPDNQRVKNVMWLLQSRVTKMDDGRFLTGDELWADTINSAMAVRDDDGNPTDISLKGTKQYSEYRYGPAKAQDEHPDGKKAGPNGRLILQISDAAAANSVKIMAELVPKGDDPQPPPLEDKA